MAEPSDTAPRLPASRPSASRGARGPARSLTMIEVIACGVSLTLLGLFGWYFLTLSPDPATGPRIDLLPVLTVLLGIVLPIGLIWVAVLALRTAADLRAERSRLEASIAAIRNGAAVRQREDNDALRRMLEERIEQLGRAQSVLAAEIAALHKDTPPMPVIAPPERPAVPELALDTGPEAEPLPPEDFIRALDFPANERDVEGFRVLRAALEHHPTARLVTSAQDLLTLLAQDGIYMDDLTVHRADPAVWRAFAEGEHGPAVAALGGIRDRSSLALTSGRMRDDTVFRDAVHHFLRTFDRTFPGFAARATDTEIIRFADTRTARAFMLTARVAGTFS